MQLNTAPDASHRLIGSIKKWDNYNPLGQQCAAVIFTDQ